MRVSAYTLGCKVNQYDTEGVLSSFRERGYEIVPFNEETDVVIINTCTVTAESDKKSRQIIRRARENNPQAILVVMGCYTQTAAKEVAEIVGVDIILGTSGREKIVDLVEQYLLEKKQIIRVQNPEEFEELPATYHERTRAYIKIEDGCENFCSYCKIPYSRGKVRSRNPQSILREVHQLVDSGIKEIIFTGIHIGAYGKDLENWNLARILRESLKINGFRLRLSSIDPHEVDEEILELLEEPAFCRHLHIPLQSGTDKILKAMNRNYDTNLYRNLKEKLHEVSPLGFSTDVIVGFPGETEDNFLATCDFVKEMGFTRLHVFPFSRRKGTKAYLLPDQLPRSEKERRSKELIAIGKELMNNYHTKQIGRLAEVVIEQEIQRPGSNRKSYTGMTEDYIKVYTDDPGNGLVTVKLVKVCSGGMIGSSQTRTI